MSYYPPFFFFKSNVANFCFVLGFFNNWFCLTWLILKSKIFVFQKLPSVSHWWRLFDNNNSRCSLTLVCIMQRRIICKTNGEKIAAWFRMFSQFQMVFDFLRFPPTPSIFFHLSLTHTHTHLFFFFLILFFIYFKFLIFVYSLYK